jgi:hypothetical protein
VAIFRIKCLSREEGSLEQGWEISNILEAYENVLVHRKSRYVIKFVSIETEHKILLCTIYMRYTQELDRIMETLQMVYTFLY